LYVLLLLANAVWLPPEADWWWGRKARVQVSDTQIMREIDRFRKAFPVGVQFVLKLSGGLVATHQVAELNAKITKVCYCC
jgi:hypothetical protein